MQAQKPAQTKLKTSSNIGRDKSFVDDLNKERGIVRMRVAFVPRSAEIQPSIWRFVTFIPHLFSVLAARDRRARVQASPSLVVLIDAIEISIYVSKSDEKRKKSTCE